MVHSIQNPRPIDPGVRSARVARTPADQPDSVQTTTHERGNEGAGKAQFSELISTMSAQQIADMTPRDIAQLTMHEVKSFSAEQIGQMEAADFSALTKKQIGGLSKDQMADISAQQLSALSPDQLTRFSRSELSRIEAPAIKSLSTDQLKAILDKMPREHYAALSLDQKTAIAELDHSKKG